MVKSLYELHYREDMKNAQLCEKELSVSDVKTFVNAIRQRFVYELILDDLPMKLFVGELGDEVSPGRTFLYTRINIVVSYNHARIIEATATPAEPVELMDGEVANVRFSYSVKWDKVSGNHRSAICELRAQLCLYLLLCVRASITSQRSVYPLRVRHPSISALTG